VLDKLAAIQMLDVRTRRQGNRVNIFTW